MKFKVAPTKLVASPDHAGWVQIHDFTPVSGEAFSQKGRLFAVLSMKAENGNALSSDQGLIVGREILTRLHEEYFNKVGAPFDLLCQSVKKVHGDFNSPNESLQILVVIILDNKIYLSGIGSVEAWIKRNGSLAKIIASNNEFSSASGFLEDSDEFFIGTSEFFAKITPEILKGNEALNLTVSLESNVGVVNLKLNLENEEVIKELPIQKQATPVVPVKPKTLSPIRLAIASMIDKVLAILPGQKTFVRQDLINPEGNKRKKMATTAGVILLVLLFISIIFGIKQKSNLNIKSKYQGTLISAQHNLDEAKSLGTVDGTRARELILTAKSQIDGLKSQKIKDRAIDDLANKINESLAGIAGIYGQDPALYLDLGLISSNFIGSDIAASDERMVVLDSNNKRLESINIGTGRGEPVAGPDVMPDAKLVAAYSDRNFVSASNGIWEIGDKADNLIPTDSQIGSNILITAYTGNFYMLDKNNSAVWRYQGDGGRFDPKANWFGSGVKPNLSNIIAWTIDGNIWMLTKEGNVLRFSGGSPVDFTLKDIDKDPVAVDIFTTQDSKYIYLLDKGNSRILVIDKNGEYKAQYLSDNIKNATKIVVSETDKKIILLEAGSLYSLDIKHL